MRKAILFVAVILMAAVAGCTGAPCNCPASGCDNCSANSTGWAAFYVVPDAGGVSRLDADSPCSATFDTTERMLVSRLGPGECIVRISYGDGVTFVFQVQFTAVVGGCGCYLAANSTLVGPVDAGDQSTGG